MRYSYSRLNCFKNCPQAFKFQYIDKIKVEAFESIESFMGSRVHDALELLYKDVQKGVVMAPEELSSHYNSLWDSKVHSDLVVNDESRSVEDYRLAGNQHLINYYGKHEPFNKTRTIQTEMRINLDLYSDGQYKFLGFIDRLDVRKDGCYEIHDYKTGKKLPTQSDRDKDQQLALYELGIRQKYEHVKDVELVWHYLAHNTELRSKRTPEDINQLRKDLHDDIRQIERSIVDNHFPAFKTRLCNWCEYQEHCQNGKTESTQQQTLDKY